MALPRDPQTGEAYGPKSGAPQLYPKGTEQFRLTVRLSTSTPPFTVSLVSNLLQSKLLLDTIPAIYPNIFILSFIILTPRVLVVEHR